MKIEKIDPKRESFDDYRLDGAILIIGGITINLTAEQEDQEVIITFSDCGGTIRRGMTPCCRYVAEVSIPPRRYEEMEVKAPKDKGKKDEEQETHTESVPLPLDLDSVALKLWPLEAQGENQQEGEENYAE